MSGPEEPTPRRRKPPVGQTIGGVLFGFEQQVWRDQPPPHELVHHARPDDPVPAADGGLLMIRLPPVEPPHDPQPEPPVPGDGPTAPGDRPVASAPATPGAGEDRPDRA